MGVARFFCWSKNCHATIGRRGKCEKKRMDETRKDKKKSVSFAEQPADDDRDQDTPGPRGHRHQGLHNRTPQQQQLAAEKERRIVQVKGEMDSDFSRSYEIKDEDHTLGNALRYMLMQNENVELCGYTVPHPMESKIALRLQSRPGSKTVEDCLDEGLESLVNLCDDLEASFQMALETQTPMYSADEEKKTMIL